jgi:hypothetical protein
VDVLDGLFAPVVKVLACSFPVVLARLGEDLHPVDGLAYAVVGYLDVGRGDVGDDGEAALDLECGFQDFLHVARRINSLM